MTFPDGTGQSCALNLRTVRTPRTLCGVTPDRCLNCARAVSMVAQASTAQLLVKQNQHPTVPRLCPDATTLDPKPSNGSQAEGPILCGRIAESGRFERRGSDSKSRSLNGECGFDCLLRHFANESLATRVRGGVMSRELLRTGFTIPRPHRRRSRLRAWTLDDLGTSTTLSDPQLSLRQFLNAREIGRRLRQ
jgi:hypothetical protein